MSYKSRQKKRELKALEDAERAPRMPTRGVKVNGKPSSPACKPRRRRRSSPVVVRSL